MGHYASEMDSEWGRRAGSERILDEVGDDAVRALAASLFRGFDTGSHLETTNSGLGAQAALAIDALIRQRVAEALYAQGAGATPAAELAVTVDPAEAEVGLGH